MTKLREPNGIARIMLGLCGLVFATSGCDSTSSDDGGDASASATQSQTSNETGSGTESAGETDDGDSDSADSDSGPKPEGLGCDVQPVCDKGTYEGNITLVDEASMAQIEGYSNVNGYLIIRDSDFTCLDFLACLETARGITLESNEVLENVDGLSSVGQILFNLTISRNPALVSLDGLNTLTTVNGDGDTVQLGARGIFIFDNDGLEAVSSFNGLRDVEGDVSITNNKNLVDVSGFGNLDTIADHVNPDKSMGQPARMGGSLVVSRNDSLERISGFKKLVVIFKNLTIQYNQVLTRLTGLYDLQAIGGALIITNNPELCVSETCSVGCDLQQGPLDVNNSSTANNKDC
jgi:hypothetical protein